MPQPGSCAPLPRVLSWRLPRTVPRPSLSPLLRDLGVLWARLQAGPCAVAKQRRDLQFEESAGPADAPGLGNLDRDQELVRDGTAAARAAGGGGGAL